MIRHVLAAIQAQGIGTEVIQVGGKPIRGCIACYPCFENKDRHCAVGKDMLNDCIDQMLAAEEDCRIMPVCLPCLISRDNLVSRTDQELIVVGQPKVKPVRGRHSDR